MKRECGLSIKVAGGWLVGLSLVASIVGAWWFRSPVDARIGANDFSSVLRAWDHATEMAFPHPGVSDEALSFPKDHAAHADRPFELWEAVARLHSGDGSFLVRFRLTRLAASPDPPTRPSQWAANEFFRGELTMIDLERNTVASIQRNSRVALGIAGHTLDPPRVWIDGDRLEWKGGEADGESLLLSLGEGWAAGDLEFAVDKPRLASSESGLGQGLWSGYLYPRLRVSGPIRLEQTEHAVEGRGWLLHHWGAMPPLGGQMVFDRWFVQFDQGQEMAVFQTRRRDGSGKPSQRGVWIAPDGRVENLEAGELRLQAEDLIGNRPTTWRVDSNDGLIKLRITATTGQDEGSVFGQGWVGAIRVEGVKAGISLTGWGFVELGAN